MTTDYSFFKEAPGLLWESPLLVSGMPWAYVKTNDQGANVRIYCDGTVQFRHLDGEQIHEILPKEIEFEQISADERPFVVRKVYEASYTFTDDK